MSGSTASALLGDLRLSRQERRSTKSHPAPPDRLPDAPCVCHQPDGRKCETCTRRDNDDDPVLAAKGEKGFMRWGKPWDKHTGQTMGLVCYYCMRWFIANLRGLPGMTFTFFKQQLGTDPMRLQRHDQIIGKMIMKMIEAGCKANLHIEFDSIHDEVLTTLDIQEARPSIVFHA